MFFRVNTAIMQTISIVSFEEYAYLQLQLGNESVVKKNVKIRLLRFVPYLIVSHEQKNWLE